MKPLSEKPNAVRARERYATDPEYRAQMNAYRRAWRKERLTDPEYRAQERARLASPEARARARARSKKYDATDKGRQLNRKKHVKRYGLTLADVGRMREAQQGRCLLCSAVLRTHGRIGYDRECIDHEHSTGKVRGLICHRCNVCLAAADRYGPVWVARVMKCLWPGLSEKQKP